MKQLIILSLLFLSACNSSDGGSNELPYVVPTLGVELSDTECRLVYGPDDLWAISGQLYGVQVYETETACQNDLPTFIDMGFVTATTSSTTDLGTLHFNLVYVGVVAYLEITEE